jgi:hypothetical protein
MANTATLLDTLGGGVGGSDPIKIYSLNIDTINTDITVATPRTTNRLYVVGQFIAEGTAPTISYYSQSPVLAGTVDTANTSTAITGHGSAFTTDFLAGGPNFQIVVTGGDTLTIASVTNATAMVSTAAATNTLNGVTYKRRMLIAKPEFATNQPVYDKVSNGFIMCTRIGDSLIIQASAVISTNNFLLYLAEAPDGLLLRGR